MTDTLETQLEFEELNIAINGKASHGVMLYGEATLTGDEDSFYVSHIRLAGGTHLRKCNASISGMHKFEDMLFERIAAVIENPKTHIGNIAAREWADVVEDSMQPA